MFSAARANALESFLGYLSYVCKRLSTGGIPVIHSFRKLLETPFDRFHRTPLREQASVLMSIEIVFPIECLTAIANQFHSTLLVVLLAGMSVAVIRVGKRFAAEAAQDSDVMLRLLMVHEGVLAHEWGLVLGAEIANKSFAMRVLDVLFQFCFGLATDITLLALMRTASLTVDVLFRLARKLFAAFITPHCDGLWAFLTRTVRHRSGFLKYDNINVSS